MTKFRKLVENILQQEVNNKFQDYVDEIKETGQVEIFDKKERRAFFDYCHNFYKNLPFNPDDLRREDDLIYLA